MKGFMLLFGFVALYVLTAMATINVAKEDNEYLLVKVVDKQTSQEVTYKCAEIQHFGPTYPGKREAILILPCSGAEDMSFSNDRYSWSIEHVWPKW